VIVWIDEHLSRRLAPWLADRFGVSAVHVSNLGLSVAADQQIFAAARAAGAVLLTKDYDFVALSSGSVRRRN
jgi:predicted nuclease of predicted toxin-antitoxin system